ncbi:SusC/RagA family TonB-linked outer membrane protein [Rufibacter sp. XAAS-G3-1]|uniref:SusC/RagA family TonB-linked outer membrane protein n=1 Tax=Rufibacter sp. XAAS-G3-1 TaxID=2729134 RepID=UPI001C625DE8|nr:SusC/RagA family TonB-linked outer membrane protein [Rufibacter sp. XAAS-G3-1]
MEIFVFLEHLGKRALPGRIVLAMKLTSFFLLVLCLQVSAGSFAQQKISLKLSNVSIKKLLKEVEHQSDYRFVYSHNTVPADKKLSINVQEAYLDEIMRTVLAKTALTYELKENSLVVIYPAAAEAAAQDLVVRGQVRDEEGSPLPGVSVRVSGSTVGTSTDGNGNYNLSVPSTASSLEFTFIGYITQVIPLAGKTNINIALKADTKLLQEVTVTGYTNYARDRSPSAASVVTSESINQVPVASLDQILQGRVPGMSVIASSGQPGSSATVTIRGIGTINGSSAPLYVMDGIPIEASYFQSINPNDIETVTVLRDASAKALYGSRGSNGVVVITTKKGDTGKISVNYNTQFGFSDLTSPNFIMMDAEQRLRFEEEVGLEIGRNIGPGWTHSSLNPAYATKTPEQRLRSDFILDSLRGINTDWRDLFFQRSKFQEHQVSISGGNDNIRFYNSLNYYDQEGIARRTGLERYTLRSNVDFNSEKFSGNVNLSLGYSSSSFTEGEGGTGVGTSMASVYYALPYEYPYAPDGTMILPGNKAFPVLDLREGTLGLERLQNSSSETDQIKTILGVNLRYIILPGLVASTRAGVDYRSSTDQVYINPDSYYGSRSNSNTLGGKGRFEEGLRRNFGLISTSGLTFSKTIDRHDFETSGYFEYVYDNYRAFNYTGFGVDARLPETPAGITRGSATFLPGLGGGRTESALMSFMGVGRYTFNDKYTLTASYRYDGSTKVPEKNRWHGFYSVGANWNVKEENFLNTVALVNELRLRASYGTTASPFGGDFLYLATFAANTTYGGQAALRPVAAGNPEFDWEYIDEFNVGFDLGLFQNSRLRIMADFYNKITRNMFVNQPLSATSGFSSLSLSTGKMRNRGVEVDVRGEVISNGPFTWTLGVNGAYNKNVILDLGNGLDNVPDGDTRILKVGMPYGTYYAPKWAGVNPETGEAQYYNPDGTITTTYNVNTQSVTGHGSLYPTLTGGVTSGFSWKGITADILFTFVSDVMRWNNEDFYNENQRYMTSNQSIRMLEDRWKKPGDNATLQRIDVPRNFTSKDIQDASFVRLRHVNVGYTLPASLIETLRVVRGVRVLLQAQNLYTWTDWRGLDPENSGVSGRFQYPAARTYTAGLNINF